ncbi:unnamed protein product [Pleuronectes platessa]|uniref:Uncharacterized protein n=1 Tax=Pleuronectes platessa TaxID=8262 RepID=A0A9N7UDX0_PLEPL|nr:unnamed protein product [Pleuronectes platessa]
MPGYPQCSVMPVPEAYRAQSVTWSLIHLQQQQAVCTECTEVSHYTLWELEELGSITHLLVSHFNLFHEKISVAVVRLAAQYLSMLFLELQKEPWKKKACGLTSTLQASEDRGSRSLSPHCFAKEEEASITSSTSSTVYSQREELWFDLSTSV